MGQVILGDSTQFIERMQSSSVHSIVTDPPYEIRFAEWDKTGVTFGPQIWFDCFQVLKPGGYMAVFSYPRLYHRVAGVIESQGFEIVDVISAIYGNKVGMGLNVAKSIDKKLGFKPTTVGKKQRKYTTSVYSLGAKEEWDDTIPTSELAQKYQGFNTVLPPSQDLICLARKPLSEKTVAENVIKHGTGALNVGGTKFTAGDGVERSPKNVVIDEATMEEMKLHPKLPHRYFYVVKEKRHKYQGVKHPTQKNLKLMEFLVKLVTPPNGVVLDPFCGYGTTLVAAKNLGFGYVGIDNDQLCVDATRGRLSDE